MKRLLLAVTSATGVTLGLLFLMTALSWLQPGVMAEPRDRHELDWVRVRHQTPISKIVVRPKRIDRPVVTPPTPRRNTKNTGGAIEIPATGVPKPVSGQHTFGLNLGDGPLVALVRVQPNYPPIAVTRGLEGYAIVEFTVLRDGSTGEHRIIESSNALFDKPALRAAERFRYKPRVVDGVPQLTPGVRNVFRFELDRG